MSNVIRLDKLLSERGAGSRTLADRLIRRGRVTVDGVVITAKQTHVPIDAAVAIDGEPLLVPPVLIAWHKPAGVVSSVHDHGRPDLALALPEEWRSRHHPVGRLDAETSGLLLFSGEGRLTQWLLHPRRAIEREYEAVVEGAPAPDLAARLAAGIPTADGVHVAQVLEQDGERVRLVVTEGKHRLVRRLLANAGHPVLQLRRLRYGPVRLGDLPEGEARAASGDEVGWLRARGAPIS